MICKYCGSEIEEDSIFCENCGEKVIKEDLEVITKQEQINEQKSKLKHLCKKAHNFFNKNKAPKFWVILGAIILVIVGVIVCLCCFLDKKTNKKEQLLYATGNYFFVGESEEIVFSIKASSTPNLYKGKELVGQMHDDGIDGDETASDGIYSIAITVNSDVEKDEEYFARLKRNSLGSTTIHFYDEPTDEEIVIFNDNCKILESVDDSLVDSNGNIPESNKYDAINRVVECAQDLLQKGEVVECRQNEDSVFVTFKSGLSYMYIPYVEGYLSGENEVQLQILTCEPFQNVFSDVQLDDRALGITRTINNCELYNRLDNDLVTTEMIKKDFSSNRIILWFGHGCYDSNLHSVIITGESSINGFLCINDYITQRLITTSGGKIAFTSKFIDKYCDNMDNSMIYFNCCQSGKDSVLADTFLKKGAEAVVCNTETIKANYAHYIQIRTLDNMQEANTSLDKYNTLSEALELAKEEYGANDSSEGGIGAETIIFGNKDFRLSNAEYIKFPKKMKVTVDELLLRKGPGQEYETVKKMNSGTVIMVYEIVDNWAHTKLGTMDLWCSAQYLEDVYIDKKFNVEVDGFNARVASGKDDLNIRSGPGKEYPILGVIRKDSLVNVYETNENWARIGGTEKDEIRRGSLDNVDWWVSTDYLTSIATAISKVPSRFTFDSDSSIILNGDGTGTYTYKDRNIPVFYNVNEFYIECYDPTPTGFYGYFMLDGNNTWYCWPHQCGATETVKENY